MCTSPNREDIFKRFVNAIYYLIALQCRSIPLGSVCSSFIGALQESQQDLIRGLRFADHFVGKKELSQLLIVKGPGWLDGIVLETLRLRIGIGIEDRFINRTAARPKAATAHFVGVCFNCHKMG